MTFEVVLLNIGNVHLLRGSYGKKKLRLCAALLEKKSSVTQANTQQGKLNLRLGLSYRLSGTRCAWKATSENVESGCKSNQAAGGRRPGRRRARSPARVLNQSPK